MKKFESPNLESSENEFEECENLIKHYEDLIAQEALKPKVEHGSHVEEFEKMIEPLLKEEFLEVLNAIETEEEAESSTEREFAKESLIPLKKKMHFLRDRTNIAEEEYDKLHEKYKIISRALGVINGEIGHGLVNHDI